MDMVRILSGSPRGLKCSLWLFSGLLAGCLLAAAAEPGSGIVVDQEGQIWFTDSSTGIWRVDPRGAVTMQSKHPTAWLSLDLDGRYSQSKPERYQRVTQKGVKPALLSSTSGPIAMGPTGDVYYAASNESGPLHILRLDPNGDNFVVAQVPDNTKGLKLRRVNGIAVGPDGAIYIAGNHTIRKVTKGGGVSTVVGPLATLDDCVKVPGIRKAHRPYMHGMAVDANGDIYVAATGCSSVLKVAANGKTTTVLQSEAGWAPTGVAMLGGDLYVLEYQNAGSGKRREWVPRVRKLSVDGKTTLMGTVARAR
jgi:sugar lactone lactonase YvrE